MIEVQNYINGSFAPSLSEQTLEFYDPSIGFVIGSCPASQKEDVYAAVAAAKAAAPAWAALDSRARSEFLYNIAREIEASAAELAAAETQNNGKPLHVSLSTDIARSALNFKFFAEFINQWSFENYQSSNRLFHYTLRQPLGVVACISPWNLPLYLFSWKIAPALAAGNCVVAKPSEVTPLTAFLLAKICEKVKLPKGVLNIVHGVGSALGNALTTHPDIKAISFTGSTATGKKISESSAPFFKKLSLEMGGKNATLIFADADLDLAAAGAVKAAFSNQGQICLCGSRILIEKKVFSEVEAKIIQLTQKLKVGDPLSLESDLGALVSKAQFEKVKGFVDEAVARGAVVLSGGSAPKMPKAFENGYFFQPTLLKGLAPHDPINQEEIFGPVATLIAFESEAEAISIANNTRYGLSASVWTESLSRAHNVSSKLEVGMVWINSWMARDLRSPFGGVKESGLGLEGGADAMRFFTNSKSISVQS